MPAKRKYRILPHTADVLVESYGGTFEQALENAALAMFETMADVGKLAESRSVKVEQKASSMNDLVTLTLGDLLAASEVEDLFLKRFEVAELKCSETGCVVKGTAWGEQRTRPKGKTEVKAVTFHGTRATKSPEGWTVRVLLDI